jgi:phenylpyruvate tautomerase PptA (4-oxalocrotonate tautomerase family)
MYTGRTQRDKDKLAEAITEDVVNILKVEKKDVIVIPSHLNTIFSVVFFKAPLSIS